jgi:hypothetical protein
MARKARQIVARGASTWLVRVYLGRDPQTGTRKYHSTFEVIDEDISVGCLRSTIYSLQCNGLVEHSNDPRMGKNDFS